MSRKSRHSARSSVTMMKMGVVGVGSYDPWTTTSKHVDMPSFAALTGALTSAQTKQRKCMPQYYIVTWTTISSTNAQTASTIVLTVKTPEGIVR